MKRSEPLMAVIRKVIRKHVVLTILLIAAIVGAIVAGIAPPLVIERFVNKVTDGNGELLALAIGYFLLTALSGVFEGAKESLITVFGQKVTHGIRTAMSEKMSRMPASYFVENQPGAIASRLVNDVNTVESLFTDGVISMASDACKIVSIMAVILVKSPGLGIMLIVVMPFLFGLTRAFQKRMLKAHRDNRVAIGKTTEQIPETINNIRTIHVFHKEKYMEERYCKAINESFAAMEKSNFYDAIYSPIIITVSAVIVGIVMSLSGLGGEFQQWFGMSVGTAVAVIAYVSQVFGPLESLGMEIQSIQSANAGIRRVNEFLTEDEAAKATEAFGKGEDFDMEKCPAVELFQVTFGYGRDKEIFQDYSLTINKGEMVTLRGRTGAGKSTLFKLLLGLYQPQQGQVKIFGRVANQIEEKDRRKMFGYVEQTFKSVPGTVAEQISLQDESVSDEQIEKALRLVGLWDIIEKLEDGLKTKYTASLFSQGQTQLLSIARAIVTDPAILLLDEITANLDSIIEAKILSAIKAASENRTVISISHRLYRDSGGRLITLGGE